MPAYSQPAPLPASDALLFAASATDRRGVLERMPKWLICVPLVCQWLWLALRYHSATLPSAANAAINGGGLIGEGKLEYFQGMGPRARAATARHTAAVAGAGLTDRQMARLLTADGLGFPLIAKPDIGLCGYGVRRVDDMAALQHYLGAFPRGETVVLQEYLPQAGEAGIFYVRDPATDRGRITGLALRYFPRVVGDGHRSVDQLVAADPRTRRLAHSPRHQGPAHDTRVPAAAEVVRLATIGSTRVGGLYRDGARHISAELTAAIDTIARDMPDFHFGRFDVRFDSLQDLALGRGFRIMEVNGAGSEAIQAWDPDVPLWRGLGMVFAKQRLLFAVGAARRRAGVRPIGLRGLARLYRHQQRLIPLYPPSN
ncbi:MAG: hypothetical protein V4505_19415 [Pseudomonadota bacterium]